MITLRFLPPVVRISAPHIPAPQAAFTLIELLVVTSIAMLTLGGGLAAYIEFDEGQQLQRAADQFESRLVLARKQARAGDKPDGCQRLESISVNFTIDRYNRSAYCNNADIVLEQYTLPTGVSIQGSGIMAFGVLHGGVANAPRDIVFEHSNGDTITIQVGPAGSINQL